MEIGGFQPHFIAYFPGDKFPRRSFGYDWAHSFVRGKGFLLGGFEGGKTIFKSREEGLSKWWIGPGFISREKGETLVELCGTELWTNLATKLKKS